MSDNAEEGIARVQAAMDKNQASEADRLKARQQRSTAYLDDRILIYLLAMAFGGLLVVWATASSGLLLYGSFAGVILLTVAWGYARIKRIERTRLEREQQAKEWNSSSPE
jgi:hypothetical protein